MTACALCAPPDAQSLLFENEAARVVVHPDWSPRGHLMVVARAHVENASSLDEARWLELARVWHRAERALLETTGAERAIVMKLGIQTAHLHVHLYPVAATATREEVFAFIDARRGHPFDAELVVALRGRLTPALR